MKKINIFYILGALLVTASLALLVVNSRQTAAHSAHIAQTAAALDARLPQRKAAVVGQYGDSEMPVRENEGTDYCALLEVPKTATLLPVANSWDNASLTPARYYGSAYDGTMVIGGSGLGFVTQLDVGDTITVVDMLGGQFNCTVKRIDRAKDVDMEKLTSADSQLTVFCWIAKEKKYVVVRCSG